MTGPSQNELSVARRPAAEADQSGPDLATAPATRTAEASGKPGMKARNGGIDALRAAVTLLVVFHHTAITYGAIGGWYYKELEPSSSLGGMLLIFFCTVNQAWFMGLFFLLAGYYTPHAYDRHGPAGFARERLLRLGIPLLVYFFLLHPTTVALAQTARGRSFISTFDYLVTHGRFEPGPLWFAEALLIFAALWMVFRATRAPRPKTSPQPFPSGAALLGAALATGAAAFLLRLIWPVGVNVAFLQLGYFASYTVLFFAGCAAADGRWLERIPDSQRRTWLLTAWVAFPILPVVALLAPHVSWLAGRAEGGWNLQALTYAFWEPFVAWEFILGLLSCFQRRFAQLKGIWPNLARRAYLIYIIHPPILVGTALAWRAVAAPALVKFVVTGSIACALCYLAAGLVLRIPRAALIV